MRIIKIFSNIFPRFNRNIKASIQSRGTDVVIVLWIIFI